MPELVTPDGSQPEQKFCPHHPPIPVFSKLQQGRIEGFEYIIPPCHRCLTYETCQGKYSPKAMSVKLNLIAGVLCSALKAIPFIGAETKAMLDKVVLALSDDTAASA